jgi:hypothetical protein
MVLLGDVDYSAYLMQMIKLPPGVGGTDFTNLLYGLSTL